MSGVQVWRKWSPSAAFVALVGGWYVANLLAYAASQRTMRAADVKIVAAGHEPVFTNLPSIWAWQQNLRPALIGIAGAAVIAILLRRASRRPWFLLAGALPVVIGTGERLHGWWAPGLGIDQWTFGAGVGVPGLDLSGFGAGPSWTLAGGTLLAVAAVIVPAACAGTAPVGGRPRQQLVRALPYLGLLAVAAALATGELHVDGTGDGSSNEMLIAAVAAGAIATFAASVTSRQGFWRSTLVTAVAVGMVTVSGLNPGAMVTTKLAGFGAAAAIAIAAACAARRPSLPWRSAQSPGGGLSGAAQL